MGEYLTTAVKMWVSGAWSDISAYVVSDLDGESGIYNNDYNNRLASTGTLRFDLNNAAGTFDPGGDFVEGMYISVWCTYKGITKLRFIGTMTAPRYDTGTWGERRVHVEVLDWLDYAQNQPLRAKLVEANLRIDEAVYSLLTSIPILFGAPDLETGVNTFPVVFHGAGKGATYYSELNNLIMSELSYGYLTNGGLNLRVEAANTRDTPTLTEYTLADGSALKKVDNFYLRKIDGGKILINKTASLIFDNTFDDLETKEGGNVKNEISVTVYPAEISPDLATVYIFNSYDTVLPIKIAAGETRILTGGYTEPVGGKIPAAIYTLDGSVSVGTVFSDSDTELDGDLSASLDTTVVGGATSWTATLTNNALVDGWLSYLSIQAYPVFRNNPINELVEDTTSQNTYGYRPMSIRQPYQQIVEQGKAFIDSVLTAEASPRKQILSAKFKGNGSPLLMGGFMFADIGGAVEIKSTKPAFDYYFFIQGWRWKIKLDGEVDYQYILSLPKEVPT